MMKRLLAVLVAVVTVVAAAGLWSSGTGSAMRPVPLVATTASTDFTIGGPCC
jgi:hypothetical protein